MENKFTGIKDRVLTLPKKHGISKEAFFDSIGMTSANFRGKARKTPLNSNAIVNIITKYPDTNLYWLLNGVVKFETEDAINIVSTPSTSYGEKCSNCIEKEKRIQLLKEQIAELRSDKVDLKKLLGLYKDS